MQKDISKEMKKRACPLPVLCIATGGSRNAGKPAVPINNAVVG